LWGEWVRNEETFGRTEGRGRETRAQQARPEGRGRATRAQQASPKSGDPRPLLKNLRQLRDAGLFGGFGVAERFLPGGDGLASLGFNLCAAPGI
jgi:hypothetical protein